MANSTIRDFLDSGDALLEAAYEYKGMYHAFRGADRPPCYYCRPKQIGYCYITAHQCTRYRSFVNTGKVELART